MTAVVCIDNHNGMLFNHRRQSRDSELIRNLLQYCGGRKLSISPFSWSLFETCDDRITVDEAFLENAGEEDICFIEDRDLSAIADKIGRLVIYRWNRSYPSDLKLTLALSDYTLCETTEFPGSSHEKITREEYQR